MICTIGTALAWTYCAVAVLAFLIAGTAGLWSKRRVS